MEGNEESEERNGICSVGIVYFLLQKIRTEWDGIGKVSKFWTHDKENDSVTYSRVG